MISSRLLFTSAALCAVALLPNTAHAQFTSFSDRATFTTANPGGVTEDFNEANVAPDDFDVQATPLSETTNNAIFQTGEIASGLTVFVTGPDGTPAESTLLVFNDFDFDTVSSAFSSVFVTNNSGRDSLLFTFTGNVTAVGFDVAISNGNDFLIEVVGSDASDVFEFSSTEGATSFFGVTTTVGTIERIIITGSGVSEGYFVGADNVTFGTAGGVNAPEPGSVALVFAALPVIGMVRRRKA